VELYEKIKKCRDILEAPRPTLDMPSWEEVEVDLRASLSELELALSYADGRRQTLGEPTSHAVAADVRNAALDLSAAMKSAGLWRINRAVERWYDNHVGRQPERDVSLAGIRTAQPKLAGLRAGTEAVLGSIPRLPDVAELRGDLATLLRLYGPILTSLGFTSAGADISRIAQSA